MTRFDNIVVVNVGVEPKEHFPKLKNADGSNMKDENGKICVPISRTATLIHSQNLGLLRL